jgi:two-component system, cell cycle response regulator DivK
MTKNRILLVEDNVDNFEMVRFLLDRGGYEVLEAHDGSEGLDVARKELPDLVLMDLSMPGVDGWVAARELKADPRTAHIRLVALTAHTLPGDRKHAMEAGFDGYITKPINVKMFSEEIAKILQGNLKPAKG